MRLVVIGLSHRTAPVAVRELVAIPQSRLPDALRSVRHGGFAREAVIISTCNRTELYAVTDEPDETALTDFLCRGQIHTGVRDHLYSYVGDAMVRHLFRVASGADSMVIGEGQVLGQVREAARAAAEQECLGPILRRLFDQAVMVGRRVRTETEMARGAMSVSHVAVELARQIFGELRERSVLLLGAGETAEMTARLMMQFGISLVSVANRTYERAEALAASLGGQAVKYEKLPEKLQNADIVVSSTAAPHAVITTDVVREASARRRGKPLFFIDLAVPRDIEQAVGELDNVFLYDIDDLQALVSRNLDDRKAELAAAGEIVDEEVTVFSRWQSSLQVVPVLTELQQRFEDIRNAEWERSQRNLGELTDEQKEAVDQMTRAMVRKMLHEPWRYMKSSDSEGTLAALHTLMDVFALKGGIQETPADSAALSLADIEEPQPEHSLEGY